MSTNQKYDRKWYVIDAANKPLGRTAVVAATILRGKHRPEFTPNEDCGEYVIIINAGKAVLTGKKLTQKYYRHHSGYISGLKEVQNSDGNPSGNGHGACCERHASSQYARKKVGNPLEGICRQYSLP